MSKLRCWPGCLARITQSHYRENIGMVVEVIRHYEPASSDYGVFCWWVRSVGRLGDTQYGRESEGAMPDFALTPLTPPPGTDITDTHDEREDQLVGVV